jgi:ABC-2 type transport system permease protein
MKSAAVVESLARSGSAGGFGLTALWTLYWLTFRQHLHGRRWMVMAAGFLLAAGLAILIRATATNAPSLAIEFMLTYMLIPQALLPLIALVYASGIIQDEQEEQTLTYLIIRPIPKWAMYITKLFATITTTVILTSIFTALMYATIYVGTDASTADIVRRCLTTIGIHCLAVTCYCCLFGLMSLLTRWTLVVGILYAAIFEGLFANLPFGIRLITVIYYTRLIAYRSLDFKISEHGRRAEDVAGIMWQYDPRDLPDLSEHPTILSCVLILAAASLICTMLAAFICSRREFYVKTPEAN